MSISVANIDVSVDTFNVMFNRFNQIASIVSNYTVTVDTTAVGNNSTGNGYVIGIFGADTLTAGNYLRGGSILSPNTLTISSNVVASSNVALSDRLTVSGNTSIANTLIVSGNTTVSGLLTATSNVSLTNALTVSGNTSIANTLIVSGNTTVNGLLNVSGNTSLTDRLTVSGNTSIANTLIVSGNTTVSGLLSVSGNTSISNTLLVSGNTTINGLTRINAPLTVNQILTAQNTVSISGNTSISNTLIVSGNTTFNANVNFIGYDNYLIFEGQTDFYGTSTFSDMPKFIEGIYVSRASAIIDGNTSIANTLIVSGNTTISDRLWIFGNTSISNTLIVSGNTTINSVLFVSGNTSVGGLLTISGNTSIANTLIVSGNTTVSELLSVSGNTSISNTLIVSGNTTVSGRTTLTGNTTVSGLLTASGNTTVSGLLNVSGNASLTGSFTLNASTTDTAFKVLQRGTGNSFVVEDVSGDSSPFLIDTQGYVVVGYNATFSFGDDNQIGKIATHSTGGTHQLDMLTWSNNGTAANKLVAFKSRSTTVGTYDTSGNTFASSDQFFRVDCIGDNGGGSDVMCARFLAITDGTATIGNTTPGTGIIPISWRFYTDASNSSPLAGGSKFNISANGNIGLGTDTPDAKLKVIGTANVTGNAGFSTIVTISGNTTINGSLTSNNAISFKAPPTVTATSYTVVNSDYTVIFNTSANCNVVMPSASTFTGRVLIFKSSNTTTINSTSTNIVALAGGAASNNILVNTAGKFAMLQSDGTNWVVMMGN